MNLVVFLVIISSVGAAKPEGDDEWVHLPNKCEGKYEFQMFVEANKQNAPHILTAGPQTQQASPDQAHKRVK